MAVTLDLGMRVKLELLATDPPTSYPSRIEEIRGGRIYLAAPLSRGLPVSVSLGETVRVRFFDGAGRGFYFEGEIIERLGGKIPLLVMAFPEKVLKGDQRSYFRMEVFLSAQIRRVELRTTGPYPILEGQVVDPEEDGYTEATISNLSGGGLGLVLPQGEYEIGDRIQIRVTLEKGVNLLGRVARVDRLPGNKWALGIEFIELRESLRDQIISYLLDKQRAMRRKGLI